MQGFGELQPPLPEKPSAIALYRAELATLTDARDLSDEEKERYAEAARSGDEEARTAILLHLLPRIARFAHYYVQIHGWASSRIQAEELIEVGNETIVTYLDRALTKQSPYAYLTNIAYWEMRETAKKLGALITTPQTPGCEPIHVESLDAPGPNGHTLLTVLADTLAEPHEASQEAAQDDYHNLYAALEQLSPRQKAIVTRHLGLGEGQASEPFETLKALGKSLSSLRGLYSAALDRLYHLLAPAYPHYASSSLRPRVVRKRSLPLPALTPEQQLQMDQARAALLDRGERVNQETLRKEAHVDHPIAAAYWQSCSKPASREVRLEEAYQRLQASGQPTSGQRLVRETHIAESLVYAFLCDKREAVHA